MVKRKYICKRCGKTFVVEVFEEGEAEEKGLRGSPVMWRTSSGTRLNFYVANIFYANKT